MTSTSMVRPPAARAPRQLAGFEALAAAAADRAGQPAWLVALRQRAAALVAEHGLPATKDEEWRFTSLRGLTDIEFDAAGASTDVADAVIDALIGDFGQGPLVVLVDGVCDPRRSNLRSASSDLEVMSLSEAIERNAPLVAQELGQHVRPDESAFAAINAALFADGVVVRVGAGYQADAPIRVLHLTTAASVNAIIAPRVLVVVEAGGSAVLVERFASTTDTVHLTTGVAEIVLGAAARLEHIRVQTESAAAWHVGFSMVNQQRDSHYRSFTLALGGRLSRHNLHARLAGENIETLLYGLYLTRGDQIVDNHTAIHHDQPHCNSWEVYKGVLADRSHAIFNGKVLVAPEAQRTDAKQTNRNLLLSDDAKVDTKPQLEIFADDVRCTHGATVGRLDEQQRYYLRTRGIAGREAQALLITAFVSDVTAEITDAPARATVDELVRATLDGMIG